jgi:quinoprotein glucose dehydrogenase
MSIWIRISPWLLCAGFVSAQVSLDEQAELRIRNFHLEEGFKVSLFADESQLRNPSAFCFDDQGRVLVAEIDRWRAGVEDIRNNTDMLLDDISSVTTADRLKMYEKFAAKFGPDFWTKESDRIQRIEDRDGDGRADLVSTFADGFRAPLDGPGIGLIQGREGVFYTNIPHLWLLKDKDGDGKSEERISVQEGFGPRMSLSGHDMHGLIWGPDGRLYWSIGDRGYHFTTKEGKTYSHPDQGAVFRCEPDGSQVELFYTGLRNPQELAFDQYGNLFTCDNDADAWDEGRLVAIIEGGDSGWQAGHQALLNFAKDLKLRTPVLPDPKDGKERAISPWLAEGLCLPRFEGQPAWILPAIENVSWGPSGLVYNYGATAFPDKYADSFFVCNFGGAKGDLEAFAVDPAGAGFKIRHWTKAWMVGLGNTDADFGPDGRLYISCFNNNGWMKQDIGNIYAMYDPTKLQDPVIQETKTLLSGPFTAFGEARLGELLGHPDLRVRQRAQFELVAHRPFGNGQLTAATFPGDNLFRRLHGVWGLGQLLRTSGNVAARDRLVTLLADENAEVRAQVVRMLGDSSRPELGAALTALLNDPSPKVRLYAAIGAGRCGAQEARAELIRILEENADADAFLRHGCVVGLTYLAQRAPDPAQGEIWVSSLSTSPVPAIRRAAVLVLRRLQSAKLAGFLSDPDRSIADEAIRAIHDLNLVDALPQVASLLGVGLEAGLAEDRNQPAGWLMELRTINANWRLGDAPSATRLLNYAQNAAIPAVLRNDALRALEDWKQPALVDPVMAMVRPLDPTARADVDALVNGRLPGLAPGLRGDLLATVQRLADRVGYEFPEAVLLGWLRDPQAGTGARLQALRKLRAQKVPTLPSILSSLLVDEDDKLRALAVQFLVETSPEEGLKAALAMTSSKSLNDRQQALLILGELKADAAIQALEARLDAAIRNEAPVDTLFELLAAAAKQPSLAPKLEAYQKSLDPSKPLDPYRECLEGGDPLRGADHFANHPAGQCNKCHIVGNSGGIAGPNLSDLGLRQNRVYVLESLVNPSAVVVPGYGLTMVTRKDGGSVAGSLIRETETDLVVKVGDPGVEQVIPKAEVASSTPPMSAMPPMALILKKEEVRDLVAYLVTLKKAIAGGH